MSFKLPQRPARNGDRRIEWYVHRSEEGAVLQRAGRHAEAMAIYQDILRREPNYWPAIFQLGTVLLQFGMRDLAEQMFLRALRAFAAMDKPEEKLPQLLADTYYNLGLTVQESGRLASAVQYYLAAIEVVPGRSEAYVNMGTALLGLGRHEMAVEAFNAAAACPDPAPEIRYNRGLAHILMGRWKEGWEDFEYRWEAPSFKAEYTRDLGKPRWNGEPTDAPVLVWSEQGFGDTLMMLRYLELVRQRAPNVVLEVQRSLAQLVRAVTDIPVVGDGEPLPAFDYQLPMFSLPHVFSTTPETVPAYTLPMANVGGITGRDATVLGRIGLCWAGTTKHRNDGRRSIPLPAFWPLLELPGVTWQALQLDRTAGIEDTPIAPLVLPEGGDWRDTARVIASCEFVITVDTAVAHLAGVMGKPTWMLISAWPDFRWMLQRTDTPWYPNMKLYRQAKVGDWMRVIMQVRKDLEGMDLGLD